MYVVLAVGFLGTRRNCSSSEPSTPAPFISAALAARAAARSKARCTASPPSAASRWGISAEVAHRIPGQPLPQKLHQTAWDFQMTYGSITFSVLVFDVLAKSMIFHDFLAKVLSRLQMAFHGYKWSFTGFSRCFTVFHGYFTHASFAVFVFFRSDCSCTPRSHIQWCGTIN